MGERVAACRYIDSAEELEREGVVDPSGQTHLAQLLGHLFDLKLVSIYIDAITALPSAPFWALESLVPNLESISFQAFQSRSRRAWQQQDRELFASPEGWQRNLWLMVWIEPLDVPSRLVVEHAKLLRFSNRLSRRRWSSSSQERSLSPSHPLGTGWRKPWRAWASPANTGPCTWLTSWTGKPFRAPG